MFVIIRLAKLNARACNHVTLRIVTFRHLNFIFIIMVACVANADIIFLSCVVSSIYLSFFFLAYSQPWHNGCLLYFHIWRGLSANLECRSEMSCTRLAEKYRTQKISKKSPSGHHRTTLSGCIFATNALFTRGDRRGDRLV